MLTYKTCEIICELIKQCLNQSHRYGTGYKVLTEVYGKTQMDFTDDRVLLYYDGLRVLDIEKMGNFKARAVFNTKNYSVSFYSPFEENNKIQVIYEEMGMYSPNKYELFDLIPEVPQDDWDSTVFQLSTLHDSKMVCTLLLEAYISKTLAQWVVGYKRRAKLYMYNETWYDLPFEEMQHDLICIDNISHHKS